MNTFVIRIFGIVAAATAIQVFSASCVTATPIASEVETLSTAENSSLVTPSTEPQEFVPPDTGGPDQTSGTGTR